MIVIQAAIAGALAGGLFAVMAIGLSLTWSMLRLINLAHFGLILLGAYLTFQIATSAGIDPLLTLVVTVPVLFLAGALIQAAYDRLHLSEFNSLIVSFGLLIIMVQLASNVWSADFQRMDASVNPYAVRSVSVGPLAFPLPTLLAFAFAIVIVGSAHLVLTRTFPCRALRGVPVPRADPAGSRSSRRTGSRRRTPVCWPPLRRTHPRLRPGRRTGGSNRPRTRRTTE